MSTFPDMIQAVLTPISVEKLKAITNGGRFPKKFMHHVTLAFKPNEEQYKHVVLQDPDNPLQDEEKVKIDLGNLVFDEDFGVEAATAKVKRLNGEEVPSTNANPHITISTTEERKPVESNDLLAQNAAHKFDEIPATLDAVIEFVHYNRR